jgi:hypothetical protein
VGEMRPTSGEIARAHLFHVSRAGVGWLTRLTS